MSQTNAVADSSKVLLGRGRVYFDRRDPVTGASSGFRFLGTCDEIKASVTEETKEKYSSVDPASALLQRVVIRRTGEISVTMAEVTQKNLALAMVGTELTLSQTSGTFGVGAGDPVGTDNGVQPTCKAGFWYKLAKRNITAAGIIVKHTTISGTTVPATDYTIDLKAGMLYVKATGDTGSTGLGDNKLLWMEYAYGTDTRNAVSAQDATVKGSLRFIGDPAAGPIVECDFWNVILTPDGELSLIGDDFATLSLKGSILADAVNHPTSPYWLASA